MAARSCEHGPQSTRGDENRNVYTRGPLMETVQRSNMFPDCKTFVDMPMRYPADRILADYELFSNCRRNDGSLYFLQMFVDKHFEPKGSELEKCTPCDWRSEPPYVNRICDIDLKQFGYKLNELWKELCWCLRDDVQQNPGMYSSIYVPNPFIVPGGRFTEFYYWDSYWILIGLLESGMYQTARGIIDNFLYVIRQYGYIPSGGRIYYHGRSQPPLLIYMMKAYVNATRDDKYAIDSLPLLEAEFNNFRKNHRVEVKGFIMYQYRDNTTTGPRPESFRQDVATSDCLGSESLKEEYFSELKSACESGMNFSSRWFINQEGTNQGTLKDTKTRCIIPVDLNAIIFRSSKILSEFSAKAGNAPKAEEYQDIACDLAKAIRDILWNESCGIWLDYDLANDKPRQYFCVSNFFPLWTRAFPIADREKISNSVMAYIEGNKLDSFPGGVPNTLVNTGLQWDYPNVWPCMMFVLIEGLDNLGSPEAKAMSKRWGHRWIKSIYEAYRNEGSMFEKYNCENFGSGRVVSGEYENQTGYGWTNGVAIYFLSKYGNDLCLADTSDGSKPAYTCDDAAKVPAKKKRELIITSEDNMNLPIKEPCDCDTKEEAYHSPEGDSSAYQTPKSDDNQNMPPCQSEKSQQRPSVVHFPLTNSQEQQTTKSCLAAISKETNQISAQVCQFCGKLLPPIESIKENIDQQQSELAMQRQQSICPCQSEAPAIGQQQHDGSRYQDKSTSIFRVEQRQQQQQQQPLRQDKSNCLCSDEEEQQQPLHCPQEQDPGYKADCSVVSSHPEENTPLMSKQFPLSDPKSMGIGLCSDEEAFTAKPKSIKSKEKECP